MASSKCWWGGVRYSYALEPYCLWPVSAASPRFRGTRYLCSTRGVKASPYATTPLLSRRNPMICPHTYLFLPVRIVSDIPIRGRLAKPHDQRGPWRPSEIARGDDLLEGIFPSISSFIWKPGILRRAFPSGVVTADLAV